MWGYATGELFVMDFDFHKNSELKIPDYCTRTKAVRTAHSGSHLIYLMIRT